MEASDNSPLKTVLLILALLTVLYLFFTSIGMMGSSFKLFGKGFSQNLFNLVSNPFNGLLIGMMATAIVQSSSTTTSMIVGMVGAGAIDLNLAIPMIMGSNIGTSITNTIVSIGFINRAIEFRRGFAASVVHDFFNITVVLVLYPLEITFGLLEKIALWMGSIFEAFGGGHLMNPLQLITKPVIKLVAQLVHQNGVLLLIIAVPLLFLSLKYLTDVLKKLIIGRTEVWFQQTLFSNALYAWMLGLMLTVLVQSSSITTSLIVPIAASGILTLHQILPYTLGANIGTTVTAILASLATGQIAAITAAFAHLMFNILGSIIIWPLRFIPIWLAESLAALAERSRYIPLAYLGLVFFIAPGLIIYFTR
ncbi:MAG: Na/Pi symporter [Candidatus Delongbacteria bacterium]|nr:Na/Pi symporter [Candidatus Delongbacteria bacterium]